MVEVRRLGGGLRSLSTVGTCEASIFDSISNRTSRFDSKVTGRFENFESPRLPRLPSYHKQYSLFNDKFQSFQHCYWELY